MSLKAALLDGSQMRRAIIRMAYEILENNRGADRLAFIGIGKRGYPIAKEIASVIEAVESVKIPVAQIDVANMEDAAAVAEKFGFSPNGASVVVVNDVLLTGRTVRSVIETVMRIGSPSRVQLAVLVERGGRELPLSADYVGVKVSAIGREIVSVSVKSVDGEDKVEVYSTDH